MKRLIAAALIPAILALGIAGCSEKETAKSQTTVKTPSGTTTEKVEKTVEKSGKNPPDAP
jgi:PBP1b-binding outer membrane lipoprotein LpoB